MKFSGAGGSSSGGKAPINTPDTIASTDQIEILLALGQGPIKGLANGLKSFFIGDTQYQNNDGSFNFELFDIEIFKGSPLGEVITPTLGGYEDYRPGVQPLNYNGPIAFTTTSPHPSQVIVRIKVLSLHTQGTDAQLTPIAGVNNTFNAFLPKTMLVDIGYRTAGSGAALTKPFTDPFQIVGKTITDEYHEIRFRTDLPGPIEVVLNNLTYSSDVSPCIAQLAGHYEVQAGAFGLSRSSAINLHLAPSVKVLRTSDFPNPRPDGSFGIDYLCARIVVNQLVESNTHGTFAADCQINIEYKASSSSVWINPFGRPIDINAKISSPSDACTSSN